MSDSQLNVPLDRILEETRLKLAIAHEHIADLGRFGLSEEWLDTLDHDIETAQALPSFNEQRDRLKALTAAKDARLAECVQWGRELRLRLDLAYGKKAKPPLPFPSKDWAASERNESKMITLLPRLIKLATEQATDLAKAGQTEADLDRGSELLENLITANQAQEEYNLNRTQETAQRRSQFRKLYDGVNRINQVGQMVYAANPAKARLFRSNWSSSGTTEGAEAELLDVEAVPDSEDSELG